MSLYNVICSSRKKKNKGTSILTHPNDTLGRYSFTKATENVFLGNLPEKEKNNSHCRSFFLMNTKTMFIHTKEIKEIPLWCFCSIRQMLTCSYYNCYHF